MGPQPTAYALLNIHISSSTVNIRYKHKVYVGVKRVIVMKYSELFQSNKVMLFSGLVAECLLSIQQKDHTRTSSTNCAITVVSHISF